MFSGRREKIWDVWRELIARIVKQTFCFADKSLRKKFPKKLFVFFFSDVHGDLIEIAAKNFEIVVKTASLNWIRSAVNGVELEK